MDSTKSSSKAPVKIGYEFAYLYLALCPFNGWLYAMILPYAIKETFTCPQLNPVERLFKEMMCEESIG